MSPAKLVVAIVLNLLVMPGSGQMYLKEKKRGIVYAVLVVGLLVVMVFQFQSILKQEFNTPEVQNAIQDVALQGGSDPVQKMLTLAKPLSEDITKKHGKTFNSYLIFLGIAYLMSVLDLVILYLNKKKMTEMSAYADRSRQA